MTDNTTSDLSAVDIWGIILLTTGYHHSDDDDAAPGSGTE
jgi:hypothetical protein